MRCFKGEKRLGFADQDSTGENCQMEILQIGAITRRGVWKFGPSFCSHILGEQQSLEAQLLVFSSSPNYFISAILAYNFGAYFCRHLFPPKLLDYSNFNFQLRLCDALPLSILAVSLCFGPPAVEIGCLLRVQSRPRIVFWLHGSVRRPNLDFFGADFAFRGSTWASLALLSPSSYWSYFEPILWYFTGR